MKICPWCNKPIYFWQKKTDFIISFDEKKIPMEETEKMHRRCGFQRMAEECFSDPLERMKRLGDVGML